MEFLAFLVLAAWIWWQSQRITTLTRQLEALEARLAAQAAPPTAKPIEEPLLLDTPLRPSETEPLILDTPLPAASNDDAPAAAPASAPPQVEPPRSAPADPDFIPFPPKAARPPPRITLTRRIEKWLAESGFAWLGGGLLALGGIFFVSLATQQSWFTPTVQFACALAFGAALISASEWLRRLAARRAQSDSLVAAMLAGAGVVTFYATAWAAHGLYGFVGPMQAGLWLALCAIILGALSLRHGQALGVLAVMMALLAPPFASMGLWPTAGLTLYVCAVGLAGFALAAWRRWAWVAAVTALGLYFWFAAAIAAQDIGRALALASLAALGGVSLAFRKPNADEPKARLAWSRVSADLPPIAIAASSVLLIWAWLSIAELADASIGRLAWVGAMLVALAAAAVRARAAAPASLAVAIAGLVCGFAFYLGVRSTYPPLAPDFYPFILFSALTCALAALFANPHRSGRTLVAASGAIGAAVLAALAATTRDDWHGPAAWLALFSVAAILFACAWQTAARAVEPQRDRAVAFWAGAAAALVFLGVESALPAVARGVGHASVAALLAGAFAWRGWSILRFATLTGAAFSIGHTLSPALAGAFVSGNLALWAWLALIAVAAALLFGAARLTARAAPRAWASEGLDAAAIITLLIGAYFTLHWFAAGGVGTTLDRFTEDALRALGLLAAGYVLLPRSSESLGFIARWRGHALIGVGLLYAIFAPGLTTHPWWGIAPARAEGAPLFNTLALALAAPATLALLAARKIITDQKIAARGFAIGGGLLALMWCLSEVRRAFHGPAMAVQPMGVFEGACYALVLLVLALAVVITARRRGAETSVAARAATWGGVVIAALLLLVSRHPWWGAQDPASSDDISSLLAILAQAAACVLTLRLGRELSGAPGFVYARFAAASGAALFGWSFGHAAIRWLHHRGAMDDGVALAGVEGLLHALWPLAYVLLGAAATTRAPGRDTMRQYLYDLQAIWASAVWPALAFAALGLWFIFNPWWGANPADISSPLSAFAGALAFGAAAWMSSRTRTLAHVQWRAQFDRARLVALVGHLFVAATLATRWAFQSGEMATGAIGGVEIWAYSAVWALCGAALFAWGARIGDSWLRWMGIGLVLITTAKVFFLDMAQLSGFIRVGSLVGVAAVLLAIAWAARRNAGAARRE